MDDKDVCVTIPKNGKTAWPSWIQWGLSLTIPPLMLWGWSLQMQVIEQRYALEAQNLALRALIKSRTQDRLSGRMFIEIQDRLHNNNKAKYPDFVWLDALTVGEVQSNHAPYADR